MKAVPVVWPEGTEVAQSWSRELLAWRRVKGESEICGLLILWRSERRDLCVPGCLTSFLYLLFSPTERGRVAFVFPIESHDSFAALEVEPIKAWHTDYDRFYANLTHDIVSRHITTWSKKMRSSSLKKRLKCVVGLWVVLIHFSRSRRALLVQSTSRWAGSLPQGLQSSGRMGIPQ